MNKIRKFFGAQDMTVGNPTTALLKFSIPLLIGNFAQLLYSTVDSIIVGKFVGDAALAAIGSSMPIQFLFMIFFMTIGTGITVMVAQYFGARDYERLSFAIGTSISMIAVATVIITAAGAPLSGIILIWTQTPTETFDLARDYLLIMFLGCFGVGFYNIMSGVLRGLGEAIFPLIVLICAAILNVGLDLLFVVVFDMSVAGAAVATIIAQALSATACLIKVAKLKGIVNINKQALKPKKDMITQILRLGLPAGISQGLMSLSFVFVQSLINGMGYLVVTCMTVVMRVDSYAIMPCQTYNMAASTYTGQNIGAGDMERVKRGARSVLSMSVITSIILVTLILFFGEFLIRLFTDTESVIEMGVRMMRIMSIGYVVMAVMNSLGGIMRGAGDTMAMMWLTIITNVFVRVPLAYILAAITRSEAFPAGNPDVIFISMTISWTFGTILIALYYRTGKWKNKAIVRREMPDFKKTAPNES